MECPCGVVRIVVCWARIFGQRGVDGVCFLLLFVLRYTIAKVNSYGTSQ